MEKKDVILGIKCSAGFLGFMFIYISLGFIIQAITPLEKIWQNQFKVSRVPAQADQLKNVEIGVLKDYFTLDDYGKKLRFDIEFKVRTGDNAYFGEKAKKAVSEALINTFMINAKSKEELIGRTLLSIAKQEFMASFMKHFVKTITFYKLIDRDIQIDFNFIPTAENPIDYSFELSTNHLVNTSNTGTLYSKLTGKNKKMIEQVISQDRENNKERYQYAGGSIGLWIKVLDSFVPGTKDNVVKGHIRYRRYFIEHDIQNQKIGLEQEGVGINNIAFTKTSSSPYLTVDIIKKFNVKEPTPRLDKMIIYPGRLFEPDMYKDDIVENILYINSNSIETGKLLISGSVKSNSQKYAYSLHLKKLVYDFQTKNFDNNKSDTLTDIKNFPMNNDPTIKQNLGMKIRSVILDQFQSSLMEKLELNRFHNKVGGAQ
ncbi:MAG: hypothetical protein A2202_08890 [Bdellovibrionales bacterium RIFOXYA1_FULL_36_14]|nr:MAG: hypothetical protein A2202_08890 [Bdellovibrionales bacterium RIFOXYA1_FULL_36_14]